MTTAARLAEQLGRALDALEAAKPFAKANHQPWVFDLAVRLLREPGGVEAVYRLAPRFDRAGVFAGGDWAAPAALRADFVAGTLHGGHFHAIALECLSELRILAVARGDLEHPELSPQAARAFLEDVLAHNLDLLFPVSDEAARRRARSTMQSVHAVFAFVADSLGLDGVLESLVVEAERVLEQRPILVHRVIDLIETAERAVRDQGAPEVRARVDRLVDARRGPTPRARAAATAEEYAAALSELSAAEIRTEGQAFAASMRDTGLVCPHHAVLLRSLDEGSADDLAVALGLDPVGRASLGAHLPLVRAVIEGAVFPTTARCIYGLAQTLERGILFFPPVAAGLQRLVGLQLHPDADEALRGLVDGALPGAAVLLAGTLQVLGHPLGIGQGDNPTCQAARAISLWAQSDAGYLLDCIARAARDDEIEMHFEGQALASSFLGPGLIETLHHEIDPVSLVLVPHLDRIYAEMCRLVDDRPEDGHKWINPEFHGWWVHRGFVAAVGELTGVVTAFDQFVRFFYAAYHLQYNGGRAIVYPQPAGVAVTNLWGGFVGWHAVSIQRVAPDPTGVLRVYFYNPNNDGGQVWGQGVVTSTSGHGEQHGESSLPFHQYASRTYVFHYDPREVGDPAAVPAEEVALVTELARGSWAAHLPWDA